MIRLLLAVAAAEPPVDGLDAWRPADPVTLPSWFRGTVWVRDGAECRAGAVEDVAHAWLAVRMCTGERDLRCDALVGLGHGWEDRGARCKRGGAENTARPAPSGEPMSLVSVDETSLGFAATVALEAGFAHPATRGQPCDPESLRTLVRAAKRAGQPGVTDHERTCDVSTGLSVHSGPAEHSADPTPVDCRSPCPPNPAAADLEALRSRLADHLWYEAANVERRIFSTADACRSAPDTRPRFPAEDLCAMLGAAVP